MRKIILALLLVSTPIFAMTSSYKDGFEIFTSSQINTTGNNATDSFNLGPYHSGSFQCVWASITGAPVYVLQVSNDGTNWDTVDGASTTVSGTTGSETWMVQPLINRLSRIYVSTTSSAGTLDCVAVFGPRR